MENRSVSPSPRGDQRAGVGTIRDYRDLVITDLADDVVRLEAERLHLVHLLADATFENIQLRVVADRWFRERLAFKQEVDRQRRRIGDLLDEARTQRAAAA